MVTTQINVGGVIWRFVQMCTKGEYQLWEADYWCEDGDAVELYIAKDHLQLSCFSGIGKSIITIYDSDLPYLHGKIELDFTKPFEVQAVKVADYFCQMFCKYKKISTEDNSFCCQYCGGT